MKTMKSLTTKVESNIWILLAA